MRMRVDGIGREVESQEVNIVVILGRGIIFIIVVQQTWVLQKRVVVEQEQEC